MVLCQGTRSIEEYVADFLELAHLTQLDEICLMIFFRGGLSEPLSSIMPLHEATWTLEEYSDLALKLSGSPFTVGVAEEENHSPIGTSTAETCHKMAADPEPHNSPAKPESALIMPAKPESALARPAKPESPARMATTPPWGPHLFGQDWLLVCWTHHWCRCEQLASPGPLRPRSRYRARSVPGARRVHSRARSVPGARRVRSRARSVPGARRVRSRARSVPGVCWVRSRARSVPGARRVRSPAGPIQLSLVSAGPAQLSFVSAGSVQFSAFRQPPTPSSSRMPLDVCASRVPPWGSGVPQELSGGELPAIAHWDPKPAMAHGVPWFILAARGPGSTMAT